MTQEEKINKIQKYFDTHMMYANDYKFIQGYLCGHLYLSLDNNVFTINIHGNANLCTSLRDFNKWFYKTIVLEEWG